MSFTSHYLLDIDYNSKDSYLIDRNIISGKKIADNLFYQVESTISKNKLKPIFAIILIGDNHASAIYVKNKIKLAQKLNIDAKLFHFRENISEKDLLLQIDKLNKDEKIDGMILQLPIPSHIDRSKVINSIDPKKDVDGLTSFNAGMLYSDLEPLFIPCTPLAVMHMIKLMVGQNKIDEVGRIDGMNLVVVGRSNLVGKPAGMLGLKENATVSFCHSKSENLYEITGRADIVICAAGNPRFLTEKYFNTDATIIDVAINICPSSSARKICGDVDFENVKDKVKYISPVPGGVGPMTVVYLMYNIVRASLMKNNKFY